MGQKFFATIAILMMAIAGCSSNESDNSKSGSSSLDTTVIDTVGHEMSEDNKKNSDSTEHGKDTSEVISTGSVPAG